jgi:hypothetical protein
MAGLTEFYCGWNEPSHASQFKWLEYTCKKVLPIRIRIILGSLIRFRVKLKSRTGIRTKF